MPAEKDKLKMYVNYGAKLQIFVLIMYRRIPFEPAKREFDIVSILLITSSHIVGRKYKEFLLDVDLTVCFCPFGNNGACLNTNEKKAFKFSGAIGRYLLDFALIKEFRCTHNLAEFVFTEFRVFL